MDHTQISSRDWEKWYNLSPELIETTAELLLSQMTLEEKVNQLSGDKPLISGSLEMAKRYNATPIPAGNCDRLGIPPILFTDGPRGVVMGSSTCFPVSMARGASWDIKLEERVGNAIGIESRAQGANFFAGVCINLLRHPAWGRAQETYGEDPYLLGKMGSAFIKGVQNHVMACAKHFACNSIENARFKVDIQIDERTLQEVYLPHFKMCVDAGVASIMSAYNKVNGEFCGQNSHLLRDILKEQWNFQGFVISDFHLGVRDGKKGILGGLDIEMPYKWHMKPKILLNLIKSEEIPQTMIDEAVLRILRQKLRFHQKRDLTLYSLEKVACKEHLALALETALNSIVLLKNSSSVLPLHRENVHKIAIFGKIAKMENIGDHGSSRVYPPYVITPFEGIKQNMSSKCEILYCDGKDHDYAVKLAKDADISIVITGLTSKEEGEFLFLKGGDRESLTLPPNEESLIQKIASVANKSIVCLEAGSALICETWREKVDAILMLWYPGMEGGNALAKILFGDFNPCAKLPISFPKSLDHLPYFDKNAKKIRYEFYHGYRFLEKDAYEPAFAFGYGLSYTTFNYSHLILKNDNLTPNDILEFSFEIQNTGKVSGDEIYEIYVGYPISLESKVDRPIKELKGFGKIHLAPDERKTIFYSFIVRDLAYYSQGLAKWIVEPAKYFIYVGGSSNNEDLIEQAFALS